MPAIPTPDPATTHAELSSMTETVGRVRSRVAGLAEPYVGTEREDILAALYETERALHQADRALQRALKTTRQRRAG